MRSFDLTVLKRTTKRPPLTHADRAFWVALSRLWTGWEHALILVTPETVIRWHRKGFRLCWTWKSRHRGGHFDVTEGLSASWTGQRLVNAFPYETAPKYRRPPDGRRTASSLRKTGSLSEGLRPFNQRLTNVEPQLRAAYDDALPRSRVSRLQQRR